MDLNQIKKVASSLAKLIDDNEKIPLSRFVDKLSKASTAYPEDQTIGMMANITSRMADSNKLFITKAEVRNLYNKLYSRNTKFAELFSAELGEGVKVATSKTYDRTNENDNLSIIQESHDKMVDPVLANALAEAFGNKTKGYTQFAADSAKAVCTSECAVVRLASHIDVVNGNEDFVICRVSFETPKGLTSIYVPVEISANKALIPSIFVGNNGPEDFSKKNIEQYVVANAGKKLAIAEHVIFGVVKSAKSGNIAKISSVDLALTKLNAQKETSADFSAGQILFQKIDAEAKNLVVNAPTYKDSEVESFAKSFDSANGVASFKFGKDKIESGRVVIANKLNSFGFKNSQLAVFSVEESSITYAVSLNAGRIAFRVPVKVEAGNVSEPTILISNGSITSFSHAGINSLFTKESTEYKTAAVASPLYGMKASELVDLVRQALVAQNYSEAEDALNVLSSSGDDKAYQTAFLIYSNGLNTKAEAKSEIVCNRIVRNASSKHDLCGHTGLPLHKVYQDKNGDCHPMYRRGMEDTREGAYFMNSKIFF